jgi:probable poly-beta-1,6-N-acetyl-D-glucosamine export protein
MQQIYDKYFQNGKVRYFDEINILRGVAILAVISTHVSANFTKIRTINFLATAAIAVNVFSKFAVPLFVFISGFVLYNKYSGKTDLKKFYEKRMISVLPPYLIFSTFYLVVEYVSLIVRGKSINLNIPNIVYRYVTGGCFPFLWFFVLIIQLYLLYPAILLIYNYCDTRGRSFELLFAALLIGIFYIIYVPNVFLLGTSTSLLGVATIFMGYLFYFILGIIVRGRYEGITAKSVSKTTLYWMAVPLFCGTILGIFIYAYTFFNFGETYILPVVGIFPLYYVVIFAICLYISLKIVSHKSAVFRLLEKIGHYSFGIYLVHGFILYVIVWIFSWFGFDGNNWLFYPLAFYLTITLSILSIVVIKKFPYSKYIIGSSG